MSRFRIGKTIANTGKLASGVVVSDASAGEQVGEILDVSGTDAVNLFVKMRNLTATTNIVLLNAESSIDGENWRLLGAISVLTDANPTQGTRFSRWNTTNQPLGKFVRLVVKLVFTVPAAEDITLDAWFTFTEN